MPRACGASSTPRPFDSIMDASGILDHPPEPVIRPAGGRTGWRMMTARVWRRLGIPDHPHPRMMTARDVASPLKIGHDGRMMGHLTWMLIGALPPLLAATMAAAEPETVFFQS